MDEANIVCIPVEPITPAASSAILSVEVYERMCRALYAYRFGTIGFLDLLATFEKALDIKPLDGHPIAEMAVMRFAVVYYQCSNR